MENYCLKIFWEIINIDFEKFNYRIVIDMKHTPNNGNEMWDFELELDELCDELGDFF